MPKSCRDLWGRAKRNMISCVSGVSPVTRNFAKWEVSLYQPYAVEIKNSEEHSSWNTRQHVVGGKIGHITGTALGIIRLRPTWCYQHQGLPAGITCTYSLSPPEPGVLNDQFCQVRHAGIASCIHRHYVKNLWAYGQKRSWTDKILSQW